MPDIGIGLRLRNKRSSTYVPPVPPALTMANLLAQYDFVQDGSQPLRLTDVSGNGFHGTLQNGPVWDSTGLIFDGVNDAVSLPNIAIGREQTFLSVVTLASTGLTGSGYRMLASMTSPGYMAIKNGVSPGPPFISVGTFNGTGLVQKTLQGTSGIVVSTPVLVAGTVSEAGGQIQIAYNKVAPTSLAITETLNTTQLTLRELGTFNASNFFVGTYHYFAAYNKAFTAAEISAEYDKLKIVMAQKGVSLA